MGSLIHFISAFSGAWGGSFICYLLLAVIGDLFGGLLDFVFLSLSLVLAFLFMRKRESFKESMAFQLGVFTGLAAFLVFGFSLSLFRIEDLNNPHGIDDSAEVSREE
jgi:hypothetical protein